MRRIFAIIILMLLAFGGCHSTRMPESLKEAIQFNPTEPEIWTYPNGLTVMLIEDSEIPLVSGTLYIPGGTLNQSMDQQAVVRAMGSQLREGGAGMWSAEALDRELVRLSAAVSSNIDSEFSTVRFSGLAVDASRILEIVGAVVRKPRFELERLKLWQARAMEGIKRRIDDPEAVAAITFQQVLFGPSPYGYVLVGSDVSAVTRVDLLRMHRRIVRPKGAVLAVTGAIDRVALEQSIGEMIAWEPGADEPQLLPSVPAQPESGIYFVKLPLEQATIYLGEQGPPRLTPDYPAIAGFNEIFGGGGFSSRLVQRVRVELGLAYSVYGGIFAAAGRGKNLIMIQTKAESAAKAIEQSLAVLMGLQEDAPTTTELERMKAGVSHALVFRYDTPDKLVNRHALLQLLDYPKNYDETYLPRLRAVTNADLREVALGHWHPADFVIVVVGNDSAYNSLAELTRDRSSKLFGWSLQVVAFEQQAKLENLHGRQ